MTVACRAGLGSTWTSIRLLKTTATGAVSNPDPDPVIGEMQEQSVTAE